MNKKLILGSVIIVLVFIVAIGLFFYLQEKPKIISEDRVGIIAGVQETKGITINYKNSTHRIDILVLNSEQETNDFLDTNVLPQLADINKVTTNIDGYSGYKMNAPQTDVNGTIVKEFVGYLLWKGNLLIFCTSYTSVEKDAEYVCAWFVKGKIGDYV